MHRRLTLPNVVTATRIVMALVAAWLAARAHGAPLAVGILIAAALLDAFDGWYARAFGQVSRVGEHMDPLADKILMGVVFAWIGDDTASAMVWWLVAAVGAREVAMTVFRSYSLRRHGRYIPASPLGRTKMLVQSVLGLGILGVTHWAGVAVPVAVVEVALSVIMILSYASAAAYVIDWRRAAPYRRESNEAEAPRVAANS